MLYSLILMISIAADGPTGHAGYYRFPDISGETVVFTAEGDLWQVSLAGGPARRLTSHQAEETHAAISPDGSQVAFTAAYEGPDEVYLMPLAGGLPKRLTCDGSATAAGWTPQGEVLYVTDHFSTLPKKQLAAVDPATARTRVLPLSEASDGMFLPGTGTLIFTRYNKQGSATKRYRGGQIQNLWRFDEGGTEAVRLADDFDGTSKDPMFWQGRIYHLSDRDGIMNLWSMDLAGGDLRQHTFHKEFDLKSAAHDQGRIVYQCGADLHLYTIAGGEERKLDIVLTTDLEQMRERWVNDPWEYFTAAHLSPSGDKVAITARGRVFVAPTGKGRFVEASQRFRQRNARFFADGRSLLSLSDESGEVEFWRLDALGLKPPEQISRDGDVLRFDGLPSPDGKWVAYSDKNDILWLADAASGVRSKISQSDYGTLDHLAWSPDSKWFAWVQPAPNTLAQIWLYDLTGKRATVVTTDRFNSYRPAWSPDGNWLFFLSDRHLVSRSQGPWGSYHPLPFLDKTTEIYMLALSDGLRSPFQETDELMPAKTAEDRTGPLQIQGLADRLYTVPVKPGNYDFLFVNRSHLFYLGLNDEGGDLMALKLEPEAEPETQLGGIQNLEMSADGKKLLALRNKAIHVFEAGQKPDADKSRVDLSDWKFALDPQEEYAQMFVDSWRLMRDYFYDRNMHGLDWPGTLAKYRPFLARITDRAELSDLFAEMVGELSALHIFVRNGDKRKGADQSENAYLGARLARDAAAGGYRVARIYRADPDLPGELAPVARPGVALEEGDLILAINGTSLAAIDQPGILLRNQAGKQVLLTVRDQQSGPTRQVIVRPIDSDQADDLRYADWEYSRRLIVEEKSHGDIGYVHLRAMSGGNYTEWARNFFPVFNRKGLVIDVRNNRGGNIDSWILSDLLRRRWMYWQGRTGKPTPNMQYAFDGYLVVLVNHRTASDGEAFAEGFRRLGLGKVIGTRTWGGEIWLTSSNLLVDGGIASAAEFGVYGPEGEWLIEGRGVEPDLVVDNPPHASFNGADAQLDAAIAHLQQLIAEKPPTVPPPPPFPDKSFHPRDP